MMPQKQILVVEDNKINRTMLSGILSAQYTVLEAENGQEALEILKRTREEISLILLDIMMPVMDGYTFLSHVKADPALAAIPVIVTTQSDSESDEVTALSHGATDFVAKPYKPQVILHRVASIINLRETAVMINQFKYDPLTGLYSKEYFYQKVKETLRQDPNRAYDIICSDIENFKLVNDILGVAAGDRLLREVADMYTKLVRDKGICGRFNADQFLCLLERREDYNDEMFLTAGDQINTLSNTKNVVMKWGIYRITDRKVPVSQMCDRALLAAGSIKGQYRKQFAFYDDELRSKLLREQAITDSMEGALAQGQFFVYFQPKYSLQDEQMAGAEALVRWIHPEWGFMSPAEFIPLFERNGFITRLDQFVWDQACAAMRRWEDMGYPPLPVSVNVSRSDVYQADLTSILLKTVDKYGLPPARLHLEITESAYTENPEQIIQTVNQLRQLGFVIEMDDFGSGYSSLNMLNQMTLDVLKLDMKFIQSETAKPMDQGILRFIMSLARWMNLAVVAEGVETEEQLERLREIGCDYVQGYFFAKPMPGAEFEQMLRERSPESSLVQRREQRGLAGQIVVVVDRDAAYRSQVREAFGQRYQVLEADDVKTAWACVKGNEYSISAMVLSLELPDEGGFDLLAELRSERTVWRIPIIATAQQDGLLEDQALALGADDFSSKPHTMRSLKQRVLRLMGLRSSRERERLLRDEACRDYLTGLLNRRGLHAAMDALTQDDIPLVVYLFDLDDLKRVNDTYGHGEGDRLLKIFGELLSQHTRETDILARYGGDEFVAVIKRMDAADTVLKKGEEICRAFQASHLPGDCPAACSAGIAISMDSREGVDELIARADQALYRAKASNKGGCCQWKGTEE